MVRLSWTQCQNASAVERTEELWVIRTMEHDPPGTNGFESIWGVCRKYLLTYSLQLGINSVSLTHTSLNGMLVPSGHVKFVEWTKSVPGGLLQNSFSNLNSSVGWNPAQRWWNSEQNPQSLCNPCPEVKGNVTTSLLSRKCYKAPWPKGKSGDTDRFILSGRGDPLLATALGSPATDAWYPLCHRAAGALSPNGPLATHHRMRPLGLWRLLLPQSGSHLIKVLWLHLRTTDKPT